MHSHCAVRGLPSWSQLESRCGRMPTVSELPFHLQVRLLCGRDNSGGTSLALQAGALIRVPTELPPSVFEGESSPGHFSFFEITFERSVSVLFDIDKQYVTMQRY
jgi:hypothetical protein